MGVTAKGPPYFTEEEWNHPSKWWSPPPSVLHKPSIPEVDARRDEALAELLKATAPWEKKHQVGGTHYSDMTVQPWDAMRAWMDPSEYIGYHVGTIIGYLSRHKVKGGEQDLNKAGHHMDELRRYLKEEEEYPY